MKVVDETVNDAKQVSTNEALVALFARPSLREQYHSATHNAAALERQGHYALAGEVWQGAALLAMDSIGRHWCESRAQWCQRRQTETRGRRA